MPITTDDVVSPLFKNGYAGARLISIPLVASLFPVVIELNEDKLGTPEPVCGFVFSSTSIGNF